MDFITPEKALDLGGFVRLPPELKFCILEHHTLWLRTDNFGEGVATWYHYDAINALSAFTHCQKSPPSCFHPTIVDLIRIHFPRQAQTFPIEYSGATTPRNCATYKATTRFTTLIPAD